MPEITQVPNFLNYRSTHAPIPGPSIITIKGIIDVTAKFFGVRTIDLISQRRTANLVLPRHIAMFLAKKLTPYSLPIIGRRFGGRDHTTVMHAVSKIATMMTVGNWTPMRRRMTHSPQEVVAIIAEIERKIVSEDEL